MRNVTSHVGPPNAGPKAASGDAARRVLDAGAALLAAHGRFTLDEVVARSGVSRTTIYRRFGSRAGLLEALEERGGVTAERARAADAPSARERILDALQERVREGGLADLVVEQVAQAAEVSTVTVYRVFGDKDGLIRAFFNERTPRSDAALLLSDHAAPVDDVLRTFADRFLSFLRASRGLVLEALVGPSNRRDYLERMRGSEQSARRALRHYFGQKIEEGVLRSDLDAADATRAFVGLILAFGVLHDVGDDAADRAVRAFLDGARGERGAR